jgi:hypothetical protein
MAKKKIFKLKDGEHRKLTGSQLSSKLNKKYLMELECLETKETDSVDYKKCKTEESDTNLRHKLTKSTFMETLEDLPKVGNSKR